METLSQENMLNLLEKLNQNHIITAYHACQDDTQKQNLLDQVNKLNMNYPGGLEGYSNCAKKLCSDLKAGVNPWDGWELSVPTGIRLALDDPVSLEYEEIGKKHMSKVCFMIMAGGLGERLGYEGVKPEIAIDVVTKTSFLRLYIEYALAYQRDYSQDGDLIPFCLFVSDDTEALLKKHMSDNNNFG